MTHLFNEPDAFVEEAMKGFGAAHADTITLVDGGVVRAQLAKGRVALVIGGGSGHYPAFAGLVGPGMAHGAAVGNVFASPSAQQICNVARSAETGKGVLFSMGNYTGDVLNFTAAKELLELAGIPSRIVPVTDDIASAPATESSRRRGVAGGFVVYKMAGRAADQGRPLEEVARIAELANERTRSLGVAMSGCTLPGNDTPLFTLPEGRMSVGMGVHGEPGIGEQDLPGADELAELLVSKLLSEVPPDVDPFGSSVALVLNGLGSVKYEELFVVYRRIDELLREASVRIVAPEVGEFITSFAMAGSSLTMCWLTDELEELWIAPASTPAFKRGVVRWEGEKVTAAPQDDPDLPIEPGSVVSRTAASVGLSALQTAYAALDDAAEELGRLDAVAGDGDHGLGMRRGAEAAVTAAKTALDAGSGMGGLLLRAGEAWAGAGGGTSGALWGVLLAGLGRTAGDEQDFQLPQIADAFAHAAAEVRRVGGAEVGDKSMVDVLVPFADSLAASVASDVSLGDAWRAAASVATLQADETAKLIPRVGRARPLGERSIGSPDPGAVSLALVLEAVSAVITGCEADPGKEGDDP